MWHPASPRFIQVWQKLMMWIPHRRKGFPEFFTAWNMATESSRVRQGGPWAAPACLAEHAVLEVLRRVRLKAHFQLREEHIEDLSLMPQAPGPKLVQQVLGLVDAPVKEVDARLLGRLEAILSLACAIGH